jgi:hypothetical protein
MALAAAALTNAACPQDRMLSCQQDPSLPACWRCQEDGTNWDRSWVTANAVWGSDGGDPIVLLDLAVSKLAEIRLPDAYTVVGGTLLPSTAERPGEMRIRLQEGATLVRVARPVRS